MIDTTIELIHVFRQNENSFKKMLSEMRQGSCTEDSCRMLQNRIKPNTFNEFNCTQLFTYRRETNKSNDYYIERLRSKITLP